MPRANNPIDKVLEYFADADIHAAETALYIVRRIVIDRRENGELATPVVRRVKAKPRKVRASKPPKPTLTPVQAGAE